MASELDLDRLEALLLATIPGECHCGKPCRSADGSRQCHGYCATYRFDEKYNLQKALIEQAPALIAAAREAERLRKLLEDIEWNGADENGYSQCPRCYAYLNKGHDRDCELGLAIQPKKT